MKELSIEEKAKRYDEALGKTRQLCDYPTTKPFISDLQDLFPELKESEDEKIRKAIHIYLDWLDGRKDYAPRGEYTIRDMIAWVEKQGEHANFRNKIEIGDKVTRNEDGVLVNLSQLNRVAKKDEKQGEQKSAKFDDTNAKLMFIKALERVEEQNAKGYKLTDCDKNSWWEDFKAYCSEQILANSAKTCKDEQDAAWSEDDENRINRLIAYFEDKESFTAEDDIVYANWLKSLKDRYTWKPSDEQMEALEHFVRSIGESGYACPYDNNTKLLYLLLSDLKKLKA